MNRWIALLVLIGAALGVNKGDPSSKGLPPFRMTVVVTNLFDAKIGDAIYDIRSQRYIKISEQYWRREFNSSNLFVLTPESLVCPSVPPRFVVDNTDAVR